jgi:hypothetical protein
MRAAARRWLQCLADPGGGSLGCSRSAQPSGGGAARRPLRWPVQPDPGRSPGPHAEGMSPCSSLRRPHIEGTARIRARGLRFHPRLSGPVGELPNWASCSGRSERHDVQLRKAHRGPAAVGRRWGERGNSQKPRAVVSVFQAEPRRGRLDRPAI